MGLSNCQEPQSSIKGTLILMLTPKIQAQAWLCVWDLSTLLPVSLKCKAPVMEQSEKAVEAIPGHLHFLTPCSGVTCVGFVIGWSALRIFESIREVTWRDFCIPWRALSSTPSPTKWGMAPRGGVLAICGNTLGELPACSL